jgi:hypothetical protein
MATAGQALALVAAKSAPQTEIESYLDLREKTKSALIELEAERLKVPADLVQQVASQAAGKPKLDTDALLAQYKTAKTKQDQLQEKKAAVEFLLDAVGKRLEELKSSSSADFIIVLKQRIAVQEKVTTKEQDEAQQAQAVLKELNRELNEIVRAYPSAASSAAASPSAAAPASAASSGGTRTASVASSRSRSTTR